MSRNAAVGLAWVLLVAISLPASAAVPPLLNYQGVLSDAQGVPVPDGNYSVTFRIWDNESGGSAVWQEGRLITVQKGLFNVLLGAVVPIPDSVFASPDRWLGLQVGLNAETAPRTQLVSIPYAWESKHSERSDTATHSLDKTIDAGELASGVLDTARFSAYSDLTGEGRLGGGVGQVAAGDHTHPPPVGVAGLQRVEDTAQLVLTTSTPGTYTLKSLALPAGEVDAYMRIGVVGQATTQGPSVPLNYGFSIWINGQLAWGTPGSLTGDYGLATTVELFRYSSNEWRGFWVDPSGGTPVGARQIVPLSVVGGLTVDLRLSKLDSQNVSYRIGEMILVYDKD